MRKKKRDPCLSVKIDSLGVERLSQDPVILARAGRNRRGSVVDGDDEENSRIAHI